MTRFPTNITFLTLLFILPSISYGQAVAEACTTNVNAPPVSAYYWPPDTEVKVYLVRDMFTPEQKKTIFSAMSTWTTSASLTGAGVQFTYVSEVDGMVDCVNCLTVTRREVYKYDRKHYAFFNPLKQNEEGLLISAWIDFDFATTNPRALEGFMAHELGHGMGLWDCKTCKKNRTIMNGFPGINRNNGRTGPSHCDLEVVRRVYELQRRVSNNIVADTTQDVREER